MNWIEVTIKTTSEGTEAITEALNEAGISGVIIQDPKDIEAFIEEKPDWIYVDESLVYDSDEVIVKVICLIILQLEV